MEISPKVPVNLLELKLYLIQIYNLWWPTQFEIICFKSNFTCVRHQRLLFIEIWSIGAPCLVKKK